MVVDLDSQANLTMCMGYDQPDNLSCTMVHILKGLIDDTFGIQKEELPVRYTAHLNIKTALKNSLLLPWITAVTMILQVLSWEIL